MSSTFVKNGLQAGVDVLYCLFEFLLHKSDFMPRSLGTAAGHDRKILMEDTASASHWSRLASKSSRIYILTSQSMQELQAVENEIATPT